MKAKAARIVCVGKIKTSWWKNACHHYIEAIRRWRPLELVEARDGNPALPPKERNAEEGKRILRLLEGGDSPIVLAEKGDLLDSIKFADIFRKLDNGANRRVTFIIGGPYGLDESVLARSARQLSLSPMTWTHELARVLLLEQIYRAENILRHTPYHH